MTGIPYAPIYGDIVESRKKDGTPILKPPVFPDRGVCIVCTAFIWSMSRIGFSLCR